MAVTPVIDKDAHGGSENLIYCTVKVRFLMLLHGITKAEHRHRNMSQARSLHTVGIKQ